MTKIFRSDERGMSAIEMAILLPLLILIVMAVIEFGYYFVKFQVATRAVASISDTIQKNPAAATQTLAQQQGLSFLDLTNPPNYICAKSYADNAAANAGLCKAGEWQTGTPAGVTSGSPYYVAIRAYAPHISITPFTALSDSFPPPIDAKAIVMVNGGSASAKVCKVILVNDHSGYTWHDNIMAPNSFTIADCWNYTYQVYAIYQHLPGHRVYYSLGCVFNNALPDGKKTSITGPIQYFNGNAKPGYNCGW